MMVVSYSVEGNAFRYGEPRELFQGGFVNRLYENSYDVFPDGDHFVMLQSVEGDEKGSTQEVVLVTNWFQELERLVPKGPTGK